MKSYHSSITVMGEIASLNIKDASFTLKLLTEDAISFHISKTTYYEVLRNIGDVSRDRVEKASEVLVEKEIGNRDKAVDKGLWDAKKKLLDYMKPGLMVCIQGIRSEHVNTIINSARRVVLMHSEPDKYGWEETHWWLQQANTLFEQWLDVLFQSRREFTENDFAELYRTNLDLLGGKTLDATQECATMSRFLYGLSSSYLLTGNERSLSAASACAKYLINAFSSRTSDGEGIIWIYGRVKDGSSTKPISASQNPDDLGTYALYEQIYALSGLTQYYRISQDTWVLGYIKRTISVFEQFYFDGERKGDLCFTGKGGYFSHIDPVTMRPDSPALNATGNREKKNWNSIGDHIPAYLINLLISIDPLPVSGDSEPWSKLRDLCRKILDDCVTNILDHFVPESGAKFVNERFDKNWKVDNSWGWQQDRGIVGHNLKISWNLTRCAHYYITLASEAEQNNDTNNERKYSELAERCYAFSRELGLNMRDVGVDLLRGGIFDALERNPSKDIPTEFAWGSTKDFWQQEQAILAYYIMQGVGGDRNEKDEFLKLARYCSAFWSLFFIDQDNRKIYFRTTESGEPVIEGQYGIQGGHAVAGYHAFELNYLAHLYIRTFVERGKGHHDSFVLYYRPVKNNGISSLNVMPDFFRPSDLKVISIKINGVTCPVSDETAFQLNISGVPEHSTIMVEYLPIGRSDAQAEDEVKAMRKENI